MGKFALFIAALLLTQGALSAERDFSFAMLKQREGDNLVRVVGSLGCAKTSGQGTSCTLLVKDYQTGKSFRLLHAEQVHEWIEKGVRRIDVEGSLADFDSIKVSKIRAL